MPKIIPELRERFIAAARKRVLEDEGHDVTIRQVARDCDTAVGTVYNYFSSKEALMAAVMLEDWQLCCDAMRAGALGEPDALSALRAVAAALRRFDRRYAPFWRNYAAATKNDLSEVDFHHRRIIEQIASPVGEALVRFGVEGRERLSEPLAELALLASRSEDGFDRIAFALEKLLK